ncbi:MAG: GAF domain-containing protein [Chloroflexota bacterium]|nr:GAF domain-containing protein [Chloroflexota bacterium]
MGWLLRHLFLVGHVAAAFFAALWLVLVVRDVTGIGSVALLGVSAAYLAWIDARAPRPVSVLTFPKTVFVTDLLAGAFWMIAAAGRSDSIAFVVPIMVGALGFPRFGPRALLPTLAAYLIGRVGEEWYRIVHGAATPVVTLVPEAGALVGISIVFVAAVGTYTGERRRASAALSRARDLELVAREIAAASEPDAVLRSIPHDALAVVDADYSAMVLRRGDEFEVVAGAGLAQQIVGMRRSSTDGVSGEVLARRSTVVCEDYVRHARRVASVVDLGIRTLVGVPIFVSGEMAACLTVARTTTRPFDTDELSAVNSLAAHASIALRNARRLAQARSLDEVSRAAIGGRPEEILPRVVEAAQASFAIDAALVGRVSHGEIEVVAAAGLAARLRGVRGPVGPLVREVVRSGELMAVHGYGHERGGSGEVRSELFFDEVGGRAAVLAPIRRHGEVVAVLVVGTTDPYRTFDQVDQQMVAAFADSARATLRAADARRERERHIERLTLLNDLAGRLALVHDASEIARLAHDAAGRLVARDAFYLAQYDDVRQELELIFEEDRGEVDTEHHVLPLGDGPTSHVVRTGEPYLVGPAGAAAVSAGRTFGGRSKASASAVHVPLLVGRRVIGVLSAQSYTPDAYDEGDVATLRSLATVVASAFENASLIARTRELYLASVRALAAAVDARDPYTRSHSARVAALARTIAEEMDLPADEIRRVQLGALLHDIGKIGVPDAILNRPGPLLEEEWVIMRAHPALGGSVVSSVEPLAELAPVIRGHHERYDGLGYPDGLSGEAVPLASYIVAVADAFEVIVSRRSYKEPQPVAFAIDELRQCRGTQFHPAVVDAFLRVIQRDRSEGAQFFSRVSTMEHEEIENVPGPGDVLERLARSTRTHARQLAILQRIAGEITTVLDLDSLAARLLEIVCDAQGYENGFLLILDEAGERLAVRAAVGASQAYVGQDLERGQGISWWVLDHGIPQNMPDVRADPRFIGPPGVVSSLIVPLQIGDERMGVLGVESPRVNAFGPDDESLLTSVSRQVAAAVRVASVHRAAQRAASTDPLTGLRNRRVFFQRLESALRAARAGGSHLTVALVDVDLLKQVNDLMGHGAGDEALQGIAKILDAGVREQDVVARLGGDEFAILFAGEPVLVAERVMRRLATAISQAALGDRARLPSISWGLADETAAPTVDGVIDAADRAMYRHKRRARAQTG